MYPELHIGNAITLNTYRTLGIVAASVAVAIMGYGGRRMGLGARQNGFLLGALALGFFMGARSFNALTNPSVYHGQWGLFLGVYWGNFSLYGGILGALLAGTVAGKVLGLDIWRVGDMAVFAVAPAILIAKLGCYGNGCCFGTETHLPWGVTYPIGSIPSAYYMIQSIPSGGVFGLFQKTAAMVHPTQLYEGVGAILSLGAAQLCSRWLSVPGSRILLFVGMFSAVRLMAWTLRVPSPSWGMGPAFYPAFYGIIIVVSIFLLVVRNIPLKGGRAHDTRQN